MSNDYGVFARRHEKNEFFTLTEVPSRPFTARSIVGMTMGARKRAIRKVFNQRAFLCLYVDGDDSKANIMSDTERSAFRSKYRIGEGLRPCPGCMECDPKGFASMCDGSGVLLARKQK